METKKEGGFRKREFSQKPKGSSRPRRFDDKPRRFNDNGPRPDRPRDDRPPRPPRPDRPPRQWDDRPPRPPRPDRPPRQWDDRPPRPPRDDRPPRPPRPEGPRGDRPPRRDFQDRPRNSRPDQRRGFQERRPFQDNRSRAPKSIQLVVKRWGINGEGIAYFQKKPVFIEGAIPGETVDVHFEKEEPTFILAGLDKVVEESPRRRYPLCEKWESCGGCSMIHTDYKGQVRMKEHYLEETLKKYADYSGPIEPLIKNPEPLAYRNSCKLPVAMVDGVLKSGMYVRNTNDFVPLDRCLIHSQTLEKTRTEIMDILNKHGMQAYAKGRRGGLKTLVMKEFDGKVQVVLVTYLGQEISPELAADIMNLEPVVSLWQSIKQNQESDVEVFGKVMRHIAGDEKIPVQLDDIQLELLPRSFFQLNTKQAETLYKKVADIMPASKLVVEAYSGIGGIAFAAAKKADKIIGIEAVADAVENAKANSENNHIENVEFLCGDAAEELENIADNEDVDTLIVDPPRSGLGERMIEAIKFSQPKNIVYVSCNPSTLAKDIAELSAYEIAYVQPLDMFSQTPHVETICLLKQKKASADKGEE